MRKALIISSFFLLILLCANACKNSNKKEISTEKNNSADLSEKAVADFNNYQKLADQGNAVAQYNLGVCYGNGYGVEKSLGKSVFWYQIAAEQGLAEAQYNLGICYYNGDCVKKSLEKAVFWFQKAAEQGDAMAQYKLGICYEYGYGVEKSLEKAMFWYEKSAKQDYANAQYNLETCYDSSYLSNNPEINLQQGDRKPYSKGSTSRKAKESTVDIDNTQVQAVSYNTLYNANKEKDDSLGKQNIDRISNKIGVNETTAGEDSSYKGLTNDPDYINSLLKKKEKIEDNSERQKFYLENKQKLSANQILLGALMYLDTNKNNPSDYDDIDEGTFQIFFKDEDDFSKAKLDRKVAQNTWASVRERYGLSNKAFAKQVLDKAEELGISANDIIILNNPAFPKETKDEIRKRIDGKLLNLGVELGKSINGDSDADFIRGTYPTVNTELRNFISSSVKLDDDSYFVSVDPKNTNVINFKDSDGNTDSITINASHQVYFDPYSRECPVFVLSDNGRKINLRGSYFTDEQVSGIDTYLKSIRKMNDIANEINSEDLEYANELMKLKWKYEKNLQETKDKSVIDKINAEIKKINNYLNQEIKYKSSHLTTYQQVWDAYNKSRRLPMSCIQKILLKSRFKII